MDFTPVGVQELKLNQIKHNMKLNRKIDLALFNLLIDLDDQNSNEYNNQPINIILKYFITKKLLFDRRYMTSNEKEKFQSSYITFGKTKDNQIKIIELINTDFKNVNHFKSEYIISNNEYNAKDIIKAYKLNFIPLEKYFVNTIDNNFKILNKYNSFNSLYKVNVENILFKNKNNNLANNNNNININNFDDYIYNNSHQNKLNNIHNVNNNDIINDDDSPFNSLEKDNYKFNIDFVDIKNNYSNKENPYKNLSGKRSKNHKDKDREKMYSEFLKYAEKVNINI